MELKREHPPDLTVVPEPFEYNPSKWHQRVMISLVATVAFFISTYMGLFQWGLIDTAWDPVFGDQTAQVLKSDVSHKISSWVNVPDAILGALAYLGDILFALAGSTRRWQFRPWLVILFGLDVIPLGIVSAVLVVLQGVAVGSWCFLCLVTAVISLVLVVMAYDEVWSCLKYLKLVYTRGGLRILWDTIWGNPSEVAYQAGIDMIKRRGK
jgi:uncharacterized membrane protein